MKAIRIIVLKEWAETLRNRHMLTVLVLPPAMYVAVLAGLMFAMRYGLIGEKDFSEVSRMLANPMYAGLQPGEMRQAGLVSQMMILFMMLPVYLPVAVSTSSVVGEKMARSLEPLLATPISTPELLAGKTLAASIPPLAATWLAYVVFLILARAAALSDRVFQVFASPMWLVAMGLLVPLLTVLSVQVGIIISSRANDPRAAEQFGNLLIIPVLIFMLAGLFGFIYLSSLAFLLAAAAVALFDVALIYAGAALFQRETILTRWS